MRAGGLWGHQDYTACLASYTFSASLSNFRPISILPVFSKVLERVVYDQIVNHFTTYNLFSNRQSGFRAGYSFYPRCAAARQ